MNCNAVCNQQRKLKRAIQLLLCHVSALIVMLMTGCAVMTTTPKPPPTGGTFNAKVISVQREPVYSGETQTATRVNVTFQLDDGSTISAYCQGNLFSGLLLPSGWVCRVPAIGNGYTAWWRNGSQLYVQGRGSNGEELASLFDVVGRSQ